jgi:hypothetical protein
MVKLLSGGYPNGGMRMSLKELGKGVSENQEREVMCKKK